eukprot:m.33780 g.33780  ORF g.33780 m.33780 type:complete len:282 (-) comp10511_c0_seq1:127-972(-)
MFSVVRGDTLKVVFERGDVVKAESNAVVTLRGALDLTGRMDGGIFGALARKLFTGESFFFQVLKAQGRGEALLAPVVPGDVVIEDIEHTGELLMQRGSFLACSDTVSITSELQRSPVKGLFSGTGFFLLRAAGQGTIAFGTFGSIHKIVLSAGETLRVDNGHLVAWTAPMPYKVEFAVPSSLMSSLTSGEGLMCHFTGPGTLFVQSRNFDSVSEWASSAAGVGRSNSTRRNQAGTFSGCIIVLVCLAFAAFCIIAVLVASSAFDGGSTSSSYRPRVRHSGF